MAGIVIAGAAQRHLMTGASNAHKNQPDNTNKSRGPNTLIIRKPWEPGHLEMSCPISFITQFVTSTS